MPEPFLEEQLKRIRQMTERIAEARSRQHELSERIERDREHQRPNPLADVRDFRTETHNEHERKREYDDDRPVRRRSADVRRRR